MNYIIIDFEYNQHFDIKLNSKKLENCPYEIIQIGGILCDFKFNNTKYFNYLIRPQIYTKIHPYVEKLTGLTWDQLQKQSTFSEVFERFKLFLDDDTILGFWGDNDIKEFFRNIMYYGLSYKDIPTKYINIQDLASKYLRYPSGKSIGLKNASVLLDIEQDMTFHDALNDAIYTFRILNKIHEDVSKNIKVLNIEALKKSNNYKINTKLLYEKVEKEIGKKLTKKEKNIAKKIYQMGQQRIFDKTI